MISALRGAYKALPEDTSPRSMSAAVLRAEWIMCIAFVESCIKETKISAFMEMQFGSRRHTDYFTGTIFPMIVMHEQDPRSSLYKLRSFFEKKTIQSAEKINEAYNRCTDPIDFWSRVDARYSISGSDKIWQNIVNRRNQIAHHGDVLTDLPGAPNPIDCSQVDTVRLYSRRIIETFVTDTNLHYMEGFDCSNL